MIIPNLVGNVNDLFKFMLCFADFHPGPSCEIVPNKINTNAMKRKITAAMRSFTPHPFRKVPGGTVRLLCVAGSVYCIQTPQISTGKGYSDPCLRIGCAVGLSCHVAFNSVNVSFLDKN